MMIVPTTITAKGQVTIPAYFRGKYNLLPGKKVKFLSKTNELVIRPITDFVDLMGVFKSKKKFSKKAARAAYAKDLALGKI